MTKIRSYFLPSSLSWWAGVVAIVIGVGSLIAEGYAPGAVPHLDFARGLISLVFGMPDPAAIAFINAGAVAIGFRAKQERSMPEGLVFVDVEDPEA